MAELDRVLERVRKCLAMANDTRGNPEEAATALRQAQKLMAAYNITEEALAGAEVGELFLPSISWRTPPAWEVMLINVLKRAFGLESVLLQGNTGHPDRKQRYAKYHLFGLKHQLTVAQYAYDVVLRQCKRARNGYVRSLGARSRSVLMANGNTFAEAFMLAVAEPIEEFALGDAQKAALLRKKSEAYPMLQKARELEIFRGNADAAMAGHDAGKQVSLHRPMHTDERRMLK